MYNSLEQAAKRTLAKIIGADEMKAIKNNIGRKQTC